MDERELRLQRSTDKSGSNQNDHTCSFWSSDLGRAGPLPVEKPRAHSAVFCQFGKDYQGASDPAHLLLFTRETPTATITRLSAQNG